MEFLQIINQTTMLILRALVDTRNEVITGSIRIEYDIF